jgi:hypothetical protein
MVLARISGSFFVMLLAGFCIVYLPLPDLSASLTMRPRRYQYWNISHLAGYGYLPSFECPCSSDMFIFFLSSYPFFSYVQFLVSFDLQSHRIPLNY